MVSKASDDFPEPESPVKTISLSRGRSRETSLRLCSRAPRTTRRSAIEGGYREGVTRSTGQVGFDEVTRGRQLGTEVRNSAISSRKRAASSKRNSAAADFISA